MKYVFYIRSKTRSVIPQHISNKHLKYNHFQTNTLCIQFCLIHLWYLYRYMHCTMYKNNIHVCMYNVQLKMLSIITVNTRYIIHKKYIHTIQILFINKKSELTIIIFHFLFYKLDTVENSDLLYLLVIVSIFFLFFFSFCWQSLILIILKNKMKICINYSISTI